VKKKREGRKEGCSKIEKRVDACNRPPKALARGGKEVVNSFIAAEKRTIPADGNE